jgi:hypothetical protein
LLRCVVAVEVEADAACRIGHGEAVAGHVNKYGRIVADTLAIGVTPNETCFAGLRVYVADLARRREARRITSLLPAAAATTIGRRTGARITQEVPIPTCVLTIARGNVRYSPTCPIASRFDPQTISPAVRRSAGWGRAITTITDQRFTNIRPIWK